MGDDKATKLQKCHKVRLVEAILTCMSCIDLLESREDDHDVRLELRKLKTAVFANASNGIVTQDTQDCLDRPNTGWDTINKLAAEQRYGRRCLLLAHDNAIAEANMRYLTTGVTYRLHGLHKREDGEARGHE
jgi:hypothetical protein